MGSSFTGVVDEQCGCGSSFPVQVDLNFGLELPFFGVPLRGKSEAFGEYGEA